ncbi:MAG TPA: hypothetical protein VJ861_13525, partial [Treponemataceae bacterium]|nr:hypothetical protein [Treponemataceae bacterium]
IITAKKAKISFFNKKWNRSTKVRKGFLFLLMSIFTPISIFFPDWVNFNTLIIIDMVFIYTLTDYLYRDMKGESLHFSEQKNIDKSNLMV